MFTLTKASKETKSLIKWTTIFLIFLFIIFILFKIGLTIKEALYPTPPPAPTASFGKINFASFPKNVTDKDFSYSVDTVSGFLPDFPRLVTVYKLVKPKPDLLGLEKATQKANSGGFENGPFKVSDFVYDWNTANGDPLLKTLRLNILDSNFEVTSNFLSDPTLIPADNIPSKDKAINIATSFLSKMNISTDTLDMENPQAQILSIQNNSLVEATSISNTQLIRINFFQLNIDNLPIYNPDPNISNVSVLVAGAQQGDGQVIQASYNLQSLSSEKATYPIKSATQAFEELKKGKAYISSFSGTSKTISIKDVFLGFYVPDGNQDYLQPIIIFKGKDGFYAYVNAITDEWIGN